MLTRDERKRAGFGRFFSQVVDKMNEASRARFRVKQTIEPFTKEALYELLPDDGKVDALCTCSTEERALKLETAHEWISDDAPQGYPPYCVTCERSEEDHTFHQHVATQIAVAEQAGHRRALLAIEAVAEGCMDRDREAGLIVNEIRTMLATERP